MARFSQEKILPGEWRHYTMNSPWISVIVPVYNAQTYLPECLDSLLSQTLADQMEFILIDDGSTDGSYEILRRYAQKHSRLTVIHQANAGVSAARNAGIDRAQGEYVLFVDADDSLPVDACEALFAAAKQHDADITMGGFEVVSNGTREQVLYSREDYASRDPAVLAALARSVLHFGYFPFRAATTRQIGVYVAVWNKLIRRSLLLQHQMAFPPQMVFGGEDLPFSFELFDCATSVAYVARVTYRYRVNPGSLSHRQTTNWFSEKIDELKTMRETLQNHDPDDRLEEAYCALVLRHLRMYVNTFVFGWGLLMQKKQLSKKIAEIRMFLMTEPCLSCARRAPLRVLSANEKVLWLTLRLTGGRSAWAVCAWYAFGFLIRRLIRWR
jgi:glycosyltransferase EpsH